METGVNVSLQETGAKAAATDFRMEAGDSVGVVVARTFQAVAAVSATGLARDHSVATLPRIGANTIRLQKAAICTDGGATGFQRLQDRLGSITSVGSRDVLLTA